MGGGQWTHCTVVLGSPMLAELNDLRAGHREFKFPCTMSTAENMNKNVLDIVFDGNVALGVAFSEVSYPAFSGG